VIAVDVKTFQSQHAAAHLWALEADSEGLKTVGSIHQLRVLLKQAEHVSLERMVQVTTNRNSILTEAEEEHILHCDECLMVFTRLVLNKPLNDGRS
jgi:hypothetical protein